MTTNTRRLLSAVFWLYLLLMLWLLFGQRLGSRTVWSYSDQLRLNLNLTPFATIARYLRFLSEQEGRLLTHAIVNLAGNIVMFIPLGALLPCRFPQLRKFPLQLLCCAALIAAVELVQLFTLLGSCDVDDLLLNLMGTSLGWLLFLPVRSIV